MIGSNVAAILHRFADAAGRRRLKGRKLPISAYISHFNALALGDPFRTEFPDEPHQAKVIKRDLTTALFVLMYNTGA